MEMHLKSHSFSKTMLCRTHCDSCFKRIRFYGLRCRLCRIKLHKSCSNIPGRECFPLGERKSKTKIFRRHFADSRGKNKTKLKDRLAIGQQRLYDEGEATTTCKWKLGPQQTYTNNTKRCQNTLDQIKNVCSTSRRPSGSLNCKRYEASPADPDELYALGEENFHNTWHLTAPNRSRYISSSSRGSARASAVSSGYSSVNQSCSSSTGTGSQRSRTPTPDQSEAVKDENTTDKLCSRSWECNVSERRNQRFYDNVTEDAVHCQNGVICNTTTCMRENSVVFLESDEESSGEWDDRDNCERVRPRQGFGRALKDLEISYSDLEIDEKLGIGPNGPVYRGRWHGDVMIHTRKTSKQKEVEEFRKEVALLSMIRHENVMLFMGACLKPPNLAVVTSLRKCCSLHHHLHCQESRLTLANRLNIMLQVAQGMSYLHAKCITVPCLRTMNIYLESKIKLCINEYTYLHHQVKRDGYSSVPQGHLTYLAPEVITKVYVNLSTGKIVDTTVRNRKMDVYAYGTVMYETLTDKWPFATHSPETVIWMIGKGIPQSLAKVKEPETIKELIKNCWSLYPSQRPSFVDIIQILKQANLSTNHIARRHSISEPEKLHCIGRMSDLCHLTRI